jgi:hypothetical protein
MGSTDIQFLGTIKVPTEAFEEGDVRQLDMSSHHRPTQVGSGPHCESHQWTSETMLTKSSEYGEPISLPPAGGVDRVEPYRPTGRPLISADDLNGRRLVIVKVTIGVDEQSLLSNEHLPPDPVVKRDLLGSVGYVAINS